MWKTDGEISVFQAENTLVLGVFPQTEPLGAIPAGSTIGSYCENSNEYDWKLRFHQVAGLETQHVL